MEMNTRPIPVVCSDGATEYRILVPSRSPEQARKMAEAQGHTVLNVDTSQWSPDDEAVDMRPDNSAIAMGLAAGGLLFAPLALVGLVLGVQSRNGSGAVRLAVFALLAWAVVLFAVAFGG